MQYAVLNVVTYFTPNISVIRVLIKLCFFYFHTASTVEMNGESKERNQNKNRRTDFNEYKGIELVVTYLTIILRGRA